MAQKKKRRRGQRQRKSLSTFWQNTGLAVLAVVVLAVALYAVTRSTPSSAGTVAVSTSPSPAPEPTLSLWLGDSYPAGAGAASPKTGEACLTAQALNWTCALDAEGGTGFIANGHVNSVKYAPLGERLASTIASWPNANLIVIDAGRNDGVFSFTKATTAASTYYDRVKAAWPHARVVIIAPYLLHTSPPALDRLGAWMGQQAKVRGWYFIDPLAEGWVSSLRDDVVSDMVHPNPLGHRLIAQHLAADMRRLKLAA